MSGYDFPLCDHVIVPQEVAPPTCKRDSKQCFFDDCPFFVHTSGMDEADRDAIAKDQDSRTYMLTGKELRNALKLFYKTGRNEHCYTHPEDLAEDEAAIWIDMYACEFPIGNEPIIMSEEQLIKHFLVFLDAKYPETEVYDACRMIRSVNVTTLECITRANELYVWKLTGIAYVGTFEPRPEPFDPS